MIPAAFDYVRPADIGEALTILKKREGDAKLLSGGISLLSLLKLRLAQPSLLVDLRDVAGLGGIDVGGDSARIGARATHRQIFEHEALAAALPIMRDAAGGIGDPQIRNWGTIGGSIAHADPSADWPAVLIAVGASLTMRSADRERVVPARSFFVDTFTTDIEPTEILTEILIPVARVRAGGAYKKLERRAGDFSTVGAAVQLRQLGVQIFVADLVGISVSQEVGALITAIVLAGRTGAAFAAQLGSMQVNEEIDALTTAGIPPVQFLVLPRMLALIVMTPLLTIYTDLFGMVGGGLVAVTVLDLSLTTYVTRLLQVVTMTDFVMGLGRASVFGVLIALAGCLRGMQCGRSASAVGLAATSAVVTSIVLTIIADGLLSIIFSVLRL